MSRRQSVEPLLYVLLALVAAAAVWINAQASVACERRGGALVKGVATSGYVCVATPARP